MYEAPRHAIQRSLPRDAFLRLGALVARMQGSTRGGLEQAWFGFGRSADVVVFSRRIRKGQPNLLADSHRRCACNDRVYDGSSFYPLRACIVMESFGSAADATMRDAMRKGMKLPNAVGLLIPSMVWAKGHNPKEAALLCASNLILCRNTKTCLSAVFSTSHA